MSELFSTLNDRKGEVLTTILEHIQISFIALLIAILIVALGIALTKTKRLSEVVMNIVAILQTIPSLALLGVNDSNIWYWSRAAIIALVVYALLPILRNTYTGIKEVDPSLIEAKRYWHEADASFD